MLNTEVTPAQGADSRTLEGVAYVLPEKPHCNCQICSSALMSGRKGWCAGPSTHAVSFPTSSTGISDASEPSGWPAKIAPLYVVCRRRELSRAETTTEQDCDLQWLRLDRGCAVLCILNGEFLICSGAVVSGLRPGADGNGE
ncbi:purine transporter, putative [Anopheles sinensis]|uniref:Purine transporter, putative n=1 Tax=Anopheles sinensis TaxID=74873 RepID=A0A084W5G2_ANOSI|nr:purine transporter, putative [Anopheles sinensis]